MRRVVHDGRARLQCFLDYSWRIDVPISELILSSISSLSRYGRDWTITWLSWRWRSLWANQRPPNFGAIETSQLKLCSLSHAWVTFNEIFTCYNLKLSSLNIKVQGWTSRWEELIDLADLSWKHKVFINLDSNVLLDMKTHPTKILSYILNIFPYTYSPISDFSLEAFCAPISELILYPSQIISLCLPTISSSMYG